MKTMSYSAFRMHLAATLNKVNEDRVMMISGVWDK
jgi:PHD/YefM family antitoxin component YafN of YafNO toxin-antitoxin module